jgi:poly-gamma-glutamate capsule biosynthesis protein CapA/YwtB (metallophosphatase superfamily)
VHGTAFPSPRVAPRATSKPPEGRALGAQANAIPAPTAAVTLALVGDVLPAGRAESDDPFRAVAPLLRAADIAFANLECPLTCATTPTPHKTAAAVRQRKEWLFRAPTPSVGLLSSAGLNVVSLANNHAMDYQTAGLLETMSVLSRERIAWCGAGTDAGQAHTPALIEARGTRVAFLAFAEAGTMPRPEEFEAKADRAGIALVYANADGSPSRTTLRRVRAAVERARGLADVVVVSYHWGIERREAPTAFQRSLGRQTIDFGADVVVGHHPHCLQPAELRGGGLIAYSLGNFVFNARSTPQRQTAILLITFRGPRLASARFLPVNIADGCPGAVPESDRRTIRSIAARLALPPGDP